jgi:CheY-like chemotaxis protein
VEGKRVLIVDDDTDTVVICSAQLTHAGYSVTSVSDGTHACDAARLHPPDVILLDYRLPGHNRGDHRVQLECRPAVFRNSGNHPHGRRNGTESQVSGQRARGCPQTL